MVLLLIKIGEKMTTNAKCDLCAGELSSGDINDICRKCSEKIAELFPVTKYNPLQQKDMYLIGWICPKCWAVHSPNTLECWHCSGDYKVTCKGA